MFFCGCAIFQKNSAAHGTTNPVEGTLDSGSSTITMLDYFTLNSNKPFFRFEHPLYDFEFKMYDRWGVKMAESNDPSFYIDNALIIEPKELKAGPYFYQVKYRKEREGELITFSGSTNYYAP
jgi:hypothetical protein